MKERLTGAIIVVALLVLLVPELLTGPGPRGPAKPAGAEGAQLRSYTIDLQDDANRQQAPPSGPTTAASDEPVAQATPEAEAESPHAATANLSPPVDDAARTAARPMGSGADTPAATAVEPSTAVAPANATVAKPGAGTAPPSADDETPRSAFGPNARAQPEKPAAAAKPDATKSSEASKAAAAKSDSAKAEAARLAAAKADAARSEAAKAEAARLAAAKAESARPQPAPKPEISKPDASRAAAAKQEGPKAGGSKGWAVQLGVFGSRDNAERLAKQVKGSGYPVLVNETSGKDGKKLYWVRVGPEAEQAAATALSARLKSAGHRDARVVAYP